MSDCRVSAIIPVRNGADFIAEALASILLQGDSIGEVIVVDDGSTDGSGAIAKGFPKVRLVTLPPSGLAAARNRGIAEARGSHIAFLDADDVWLPGKIARQLAELGAATTALCLTMLRHVKLSSGASAPLPAALAVPGEGASALLGRSMTCLLAPRAVFHQVGAFDGSTRTRGDQDWFLRAEAAGVTTVVVRDVLALRRIHGANHSLAFADAVLDDFITIAKRNLDRKRAAARGDSGPLP